MNNIIKKIYFNKIIKNSPLCQKAIRELKLAGYINSNDKMSRLMVNQVLETLAVFSSHKNFSFLPHTEFELFNILANHKILTPLTFKDNEWDKIDKHLWQNNRIDSIFKDNTGRIQYANAYCCEINRSYSYKTKKWNKDSEVCYYPYTVFLYNGFDKFTGEILKGAYFTEQTIETGIIPKNTIKLDSTKIRMINNSCIICVNVNDTNFTELQSNYNLVIKYSATLAKKDILDITPELEKQILKELKNE